MRKGYPVWIKQAGVKDGWKRAPVAWESCWDMRRWVKEGWPLRFIFNYALALHGSVLNNKSAPLPEGPGIREEIERFVRRLGYRLVLRELKHPATAVAGKPLAMTMKWQNVGSAPCYRPYRIAYRLSNDEGYAKVIPSTVRVNDWMPGSVPLFTEEFFEGRWEFPNGAVVEVKDEVPVPADVAPGRYGLSLAVVGERDLRPAIRLAIEGRGDDGWYRLSELAVERQGREEAGPQSRGGVPRSPEGVGRE